MMLGGFTRPYDVVVGLGVLGGAKSDEERRLRWLGK